MKTALILITASLFASETADPRIVYLQAHVKTVEAAAAIDKLNAEYVQRFMALRDASIQRQAEEKAALQDLAKKLGCADGVDTDKLACK